MSSSDSSGATRSVGSIVVGQLEAHGVPRVYCVPGESYLDVLDALHDSPIETIVCRQEGGAGFMALAESALTGRPGVAMVTRGPGAANAMIAVHTSWQDATPFVLLVGLIPVADRHRESFQEFDLGAWFGSTAKRVVTIDDPDRAADLLAEAFQIAASGRPGPVVVGLPEDVLVRHSSVVDAAVRAVAGGGVGPADRQSLQALVAEAHRPLVIVGGQRWSTQTAAELVSWARTRHIPVVTDWRSQDIVDNDDPAFGGWLGYGRNDATVDALARADLHLFVGCGFADVASDGYLARDPDARAVVVDPDPDLRGHQGRVDLHILATPAAFVAAVGHEEPGTGEHPPEADADRLAWCRDLRTAQESFATPHPEVSRGVDLGTAMALLAERLEPDAVVTYGAGNHALWAQRYLTRRVFPSLLSPRNGAMGFGVPAAVAAALVHPGRRVVSVAGDGCFLMNGQELATAAAYGAAPVILIADNAQYGTIRQHQEHSYPGRVSGTALVNPDFASYAESFGAHGERVERTEDLAGALDRAFASGRAAVLHLLTDPAVLAPGKRIDRLAAPPSVVADSPVQPREGT